MHPSPHVNLGNLLLSLSDAMDLVSPLIVSHQQRTAFIAWEICKQAKLGENAVERTTRPSSHDRKNIEKLPGIAAGCQVQQSDIILPMGNRLVSGAAAAACCPPLSLTISNPKFKN